eukprot:gene1134-1693_t
MSVHLATVLKSGRPLEDLMINPVASFDFEVLERSMPSELIMGALNLEDATLKAVSDNRTLVGTRTMDPSPDLSTARDLWATILVVQCLRTYPFTWIENPDEPPWRQRLGRVLKPEIRAANLVRSWRTSLKHTFIRVAKGHPLTAIFLVTATEPFTRSDRILVQANTFICMLLFAVWFFYSKAVNCCRELRTLLSCPSSSDVDSACLGFLTCAELAVGESDRIWMAFIMIGILTPLTLMLSRLFILAANANIPNNWEIREVPKKGIGSAGIATAALQTVLLTIYAIFFKFEKMNKAIAVTFVAVIGAIVKSSKGATSRNHPRVDLPTERAELHPRIHVNMQHIAYGVIIVLWFVISWTLFTYASLLRNMMSAKAENEFLTMWAVAFGLGLFGVETLQIIFIQIFASVIGEKLQSTQPISGGGELASDLIHFLPSHLCASHERCMLDEIVADRMHSLLLYLT